MFLIYSHTKSKFKRLPFQINTCACIESPPPGTRKSPDSNNSLVKAPGHNTLSIGL